MIGLGERVATHGLNQAAGRRQMRRVLSLEQVHAANSDYTATITQRGAKLKIDYQHMCTEVTAVEDASSDAGKKLTYQFNDGGNVVCVRDELGYARFTKYDSAIENTPSDSSRLQKAVVNLLTHPDLRSGWSQLTGTSGDSAGPDTATLCLNMATMYLHKAAAGGEPCEHPEQRQFQPDVCQRRAGLAQRLDDGRKHGDDGQ